MNKRVIIVAAAACAVLSAASATAAPPTALANPVAKPAVNPADGVVSLQFDDPADNKKYVDWHTCGAVLIAGAPRWAATAAHCVTDEPGQPSPAPVNHRRWHVRAGSMNRTQGGETAGVDQIVVHPGWNWASNPDEPTDDVALVELDHPLKQPGLPLAKQSARPREAVTVLGWGIHSNNETVAPVYLRAVMMHVIPPCTGASRGEFCAITPHGAAGMCNGGSGTPLVQWISGRPTVAGLLSRGMDESRPCGATPMIATDLTEHASWIRSVIGTGGRS